MWLLIPFIAMAMGFSSDDGPARIQIHVSARTGSDETGKGSETAPFRSITRALTGLKPGDAPKTLIHLDVGTYSPDSGESLPLILEAGLHLKGWAAGATILDGKGETALLLVRGAAAPSVIENLTLRNAGTGIRFPHNETGGGGKLLANNLQMKSLDCGMEIRADEAPGSALVRISISSFRASECSEGIRFQGEGPMHADLRYGSFNRNGIGVFLKGDTLKGLGVHHTLTFQECLFTEHETAGVLRRGADGKNRSAAPYHFKQCIFRGNAVGLHFEMPAGDSPLDLETCSFLENTLFGLKIIGREGDPSIESRIRDSLFLWNGVGLQLTSTQVVYLVQRNRIMDNLGNGIFCGNVLAKPTRILFTDNLIAHNGASGIYCLSDGRHLKVQCINNTIVFNGDYGLRRHNKHGGESEHEIRNSIFAGNREDMAWIREEEVFNCLMAGGQFVDANGNMTGDPGFVDPSVRDYRLKTASPCRNRGREDTEVHSGDLDLNGQNRRVGVIDLGAFEGRPSEQR